MNVVNIRYTAIQIRYICHSTQN